jgi:hypothetical protein
VVPPRFSPWPPVLGFRQEQGVFAVDAISVAVAFVVSALRCDLIWEVARRLPRHAKTEGRARQPPATRCPPRARLYGPQSASSSDHATAIRPARITQLALRQLNESLPIQGLDCAHAPRLLDAVDPGQPAS